MSLSKQRLIENTPRDHPDHNLLLGAEVAIHEVALRINSVKESKHEESLQETLRTLEFLLVTDVSCSNFSLPYNALYLHQLSLYVLYFQQFSTMSSDNTPCEITQIIMASMCLLAKKKSQTSIARSCSFLSFLNALLVGLNAKYRGLFKTP